MARPPETMIFAEVSSGRSLFATSSPTKDERPGSAAAAAFSTGALPLLDASELGGGIGGSLGAGTTCDQHMHVAAELAGGGQRLVGGVLEVTCFVFGNQQRSHQRTPASVFSLETSSATSFTLTP